MKYAVRYFSKFGHSEQMAKVVGEVVKTQPETVAVPLSEPVDTLYLGAGVFLGKVNGAIGQFIDTLKPEQVKNVVCFGSCAIIDSPVGATSVRSPAKVRWDLSIPVILIRKTLLTYGRLLRKR